MDFGSAPAENVTKEDGWKQWIPTGIRFRPTDEELIVHYLLVKLSGGLILSGIINDINIYNHEPDQLQNLAINHGDKMYFFTPRFRKTEKGSKINRLTKLGYWRASQTANPVFDKNGKQIGTKRPLVYHYKPNKNGLEIQKKGVKTEWLMNEYMLLERAKSSRSENTQHCIKLDELVLCEIHYRKSGKSSSNNTNKGLKSETLQGVSRSTYAYPNPNPSPSPKSNPCPIVPVSHQNLCPLPSLTVNYNSHIMVDQGLYPIHSPTIPVANGYYVSNPSHTHSTNPNPNLILNLNTNIILDLNPSNVNYAEFLKDLDDPRLMFAEDELLGML